MSLQPLRETHRLDRRAALDLRSWRVLANDRTPLGVVAEVIVDADDARPVYLQVLPDAEPAGAPAECWVRVPCRHVVVDENARAVVLSDAALLGLGTATMGRWAEDRARRG
jgi:hypothetical protein